MNTYLVLLHVLKGALGNKVHITFEKLKDLFDMQDIGLKSNRSSVYTIRCESLENGILEMSFT